MGGERAATPFPPAFGIGELRAELAFWRFEDMSAGFFIIALKAFFDNRNAAGPVVAAPVGPVGTLLRKMTFNWRVQQRTFHSINSRILNGLKILRWDLRSREESKFRVFSPVLQAFVNIFFRDRHVAEVVDLWKIRCLATGSFTDEETFNGKETIMKHRRNNMPLKPLSIKADGVSVRSNRNS